MMMRTTVVDGGGYHAATQAEYGPAFAAALGYVPFAGSLNVDLDDPVVPSETFGPAPSRIAATRLFQAWPVAISGHDGPAHLLLWRDADVPQWKFEIVAPVRLRPVVGPHPTIQVLAPIH